MTTMDVITQYRANVATGSLVVNSLRSRFFLSLEETTE